MAHKEFKFLNHILIRHRSLGCTGCTFNKAVNKHGGCRIVSWRLRLKPNATFDSHPCYDPVTKQSYIFVRLKKQVKKQYNEYEKDIIANYPSLYNNTS